MLSVVDVRPNVPEPSVIDGTSPVHIPSVPCAPGTLTRMRLAGISKLKRSIRA
jgi:hypothetical protein